MYEFDDRKKVVDRQSLRDVSLDAVKAIDVVLRIRDL